MAEAPPSKSCKLDLGAPKFSPGGFGQFQVELSWHLTCDSVKELATIFGFPPAKFDRVKRDSLEFVRLLVAEGVITPADISTLISALKSINQAGIASTVQQSFDRNRITEIEKEDLDVLLPELQRKLSVFVKALKKGFSRRYSGVRLIPFLYGTWYCVNDIFVESKLEVFDNTKQKQDPSRRTSVTSRHEIFTRSLRENIIIVEGEPGFGKSTLLLQFAYDWCTSSTQSPLKDVDIFILIRLKEINDTPTLFDAIRMLLPDDLPLTSQDIGDIITSGHWKVVIALDGYDEYLGTEERATDIDRITQGRILTDCIVVITTRPSCLPKLQSPNASHFKLSGFEKQMQEEYIDKAITFSMTTRRGKEFTIGRLQENVILWDICQVPFFFATFVHMSSISAGKQELNSVTSYFSFMLACFFSHLGSKEVADTRPIAPPTTTEDPEQRRLIAKLAFLGLAGKEVKLRWTQADLIQQLGQSCYNRYINAGVLLEEEHRTFQAVSGSHADSQIVVETYARFFHKTFQEFYAAYHIAYLAENQSVEVVKNILSKLDLNDLQYVLRFACGLRPTAARLVQTYLSTLGDAGRKCSILCLMEQQGVDINETVAYLCRNAVTINNRDSKFLQRSKIQLLHAASQRNVISVSHLSLIDCFRAVESNRESLLLSSGLQLPRLDTLQRLNINFGIGGDLRCIAGAILDYTARCASLKYLELSVLPFFGKSVLLPWSFEVNGTLATLHRQNCIVRWPDCSMTHVGFRVYVKWRLNLLSGKWEDEDNGAEMTETYYRQVASLLEIQV
ncbi:NACHT, LRR and PYD domains-containing protein 3 [Holothuria leucospilota]|uniref:NACHT, LRR and PYD domains-containing protein 3 n=1 Tax=Holothuria leucospilota TaxID=206669 RepID=A0A9Q0YQW1_HOLLE|nr:NACHT, LRR and PYD domains-containing protein 3 [Holothuria leucospilota]